ncbi:biotin transporter BioY [Candidatus Enterococcus mangumiae]|uniref:Biotin transporter n=1 Tax=Candidatus Enterococcus mangumiae TaxID=2230878 RepID=A0ABZ2SVP8_9ENTE|nr:biotin transporter BioY [Enterococcus sp. DIV1094]MBO0489191.1 biotin transporter BioY [Enterococcus sp. DIV1094]
MTKSLKELILVAEFTAIIAVLSQFAIPLGVIPLTGQTFAIGLTATFLGKRTGTLAVCMYLLLGLIGLPVFSGTTGGIGVLFGPSGGYLFGFILQSFVIGWWIEKTSSRFFHAWYANLFGSLLALVVGTLWLSFSGNLSFQTALLSGFVPFLLPELIKSTGAAYVGSTLRRRLHFKSETILSSKK